jgi:hypothetical protein
MRSTLRSKAKLAKKDGETVSFLIQQAIRKYQVTEITTLCLRERSGLLQNA